MRRPKDSVLARAMVEGGKALQRVIFEKAIRRARGNRAAIAAELEVSPGHLAAYAERIGLDWDGLLAAAAALPPDEDSSVDDTIPS